MRTWLSCRTAARLSEQAGDLLRAAYGIALESGECSQICEKAGWVIMEVQKRGTLAVEDAALALKQPGDFPELLQQRLQGVERRQPCMLHPPAPRLGPVLVLPALRSGAVGFQAAAVGGRLIALGMRLGGIGAQQYSFGI